MPVMPRILPPETEPGVRRRATLTALVLALPLLLGAWMTADAHEASLAGIEGPPCPVGATLGETVCPGCGLTRSTALSVQGRFDDAFAVHPAGMLVVLLCVSGLLVQADILRRGSSTETHRKLRRLGRLVFVAGLLAAYGIRIL